MEKGYPTMGQGNTFPRGGGGKKGFSIYSRKSNVGVYIWMEGKGAFLKRNIAWRKRVP